MCRRTTELKPNLTCAEVFDIVTALNDRASKLIEMNAPEDMVTETINCARRLNNMLKEAGYDHWLDSVFV